MERRRIRKNHGEKKYLAKREVYQTNTLEEHRQGGQVVQTLFSVECGRDSLLFRFVVSTVR